MRVPQSDAKVPLREVAHPKVNLTLRVLSRRPDGYHELESLVAFALDLGDELTLVPGASRNVTCTGPYGATIAGPNLIAVALDHVAATHSNLTVGDVTLAKHLPIAAGIGGGSADAAAVMRLVASANGSRCADVDWHRLAAKIGADVPVCLLSRAQVMRGIGELITPIGELPPLAAVLINPMVAVPVDKTAQVFRRLAAGPVANPLPVRVTPHADRPTLIDHMALMGNDLTPPARAVVPAIDAVLTALRIIPGCDLAQLSGGGPTCFGIFPDLERAHLAAARLTSAHPTWWIRASRLG